MRPATQSVYVSQRAREAFNRGSAQRRQQREPQDLQAISELAELGQDKVNENLESIEESKQPQDDEQNCQSDASYDSEELDGNLDDDNVKPTPERKRGQRKYRANVDTNVIQVSFVNDSMPQTKVAEPFFCACKAVLNQHSLVKDGLWTCEFCGYKNKIPDGVEIPTEENVCYVTKQG